MGSNLGFHTASEVGNDSVVSAVDADFYSRAPAVSSACFR